MFGVFAADKLRSGQGVVEKEAATNPDKYILNYNIAYDIYWECRTKALAFLTELDKQLKEQTVSVNKRKEILLFVIERILYWMDDLQINDCDDKGWYGRNSRLMRRTTTIYLGGREVYKGWVFEAGNDNLDTIVRNRIDQRLARIARTTCFEWEKQDCLLALTKTDKAIQYRKNVSANWGRRQNNILGKLLRECDPQIGSHSFNTYKYSETTAESWLHAQTNLVHNLSIYQTGELTLYNEKDRRLPAQVMTEQARMTRFSRKIPNRPINPLFA